MVILCLSFFYYKPKDYSFLASAHRCSLSKIKWTSPNSCKLKPKLKVERFCQVNMQSRRICGRDSREERCSDHLLNSVDSHNCNSLEARAGFSCLKLAILFLIWRSICLMMESVEQKSLQCNLWYTSLTGWWSFLR